MDKQQSATISARIVGIITAPFAPKDAAGIVIALNEAANLPLHRVIVVHDTEGKSGQYVDAAIAATATKYAVSQIELVKLVVTTDETALRWRFGADAALSDPSIDCVLFIPGDFTSKLRVKQRACLRDMASNARRDTLIIGDFRAKPSFKEHFDALVGLPAVEAMYPGYTAKIVRHKLHKLRSEFFCLGHDVLVRARKEMTHWDMDPTISLILVVLRAADLTLKVIDLGSFNDEPGTRRPLGQMLQISRYVTQLVVNRIRLEISQWPAESDQLIRYDDLRPRIEATFKSCLEGIDANRRSLDPEPGTYQRKFNTNNKTRVSFNIGWQDFFGFSLLADPTEADLVEESPGVLTMRNTPGSNDLYDALGDLVFGPWGDALEEEFVFARLPYSSYHVTAKDGVNVDNIHRLRPSAATAFEEWFDTLPGSLAQPISILPPPLHLSAPIRFRFDRLTIWNRSVLVARITPADAESRLLVSDLKRHRRALDRKWEKDYGLPKPENTGWSPHVSLGYFPNRAIVPISETRLARWSTEFAARIGVATCSFASFSPYGFLNMATFVKAREHR